MKKQKEEWEVILEKFQEQAALEAQKQSRRNDKASYLGMALAHLNCVLERVRENDDWYALNLDWESTKKRLDDARSSAQDFIDWATKEGIF